MLWWYHSNETSLDFFRDNILHYFFLKILQKEILILSLLFLWPLCYYTALMWPDFF